MRASVGRRSDAAYRLSSSRANVVSGERCGGLQQYSERECRGGREVLSLA